MKVKKYIYWNNRWLVCLALFLAAAELGAPPAEATNLGFEEISGVSLGMATIDLVKRRPKVQTFMGDLEKGATVDVEREEQVLAELLPQGVELEQALYFVQNRKLSVVRLLGIHDCESIQEIAAALGDRMRAVYERDPEKGQTLLKHGGKTNPAPLEKWSFGDLIVGLSWTPREFCDAGNKGFVAVALAEDLEHFSQTMPEEMGSSPAYGQEQMEDRR